MRQRQQRRKRQTCKSKENISVDCTKKVFASRSAAINQLASYLFESNHSSSIDEAQIIAECVIEISLLGDRPIAQNKGSISHDDPTWNGEDLDINDNALLSQCASSLQEYLDISSQESAIQILQAAFLPWRVSISSDEEDDKEHADSTENDGKNSDDDVNSDEEECVGEGDCELCERTMPLTKHHLIPKSTWPAMKRRILNAEGSKNESILLECFQPHLPEDLTSASVRVFLVRTCSICRPCHSMIHRIHDNKVLAENFNTVDKLLTDEDVVKFCRWANKQRTGRRTHASQLKYSR
mmetsp:Transcript_31811/g.46880  ORF Transcript_31811/g.46880 Transcript_31811/m.46880 type:complete len:296 (+) Transcript_31811:88-975(+)|eukprot:CAMPEP_0195525814 /NCGR_PEP_ID=MMETSP0794_2-20130614/26453_1 /TAXON_ID=515487 /ORGANISM="Stephanopyxis turris, Strain CCMP 815" /LENGTH=295 /DNA_ID=CAMNT_0040656353 /DNA_START=87 /DNA_END=974 /DNA_ORIENTATION=+